MVATAAMAPASFWRPGWASIAWPPMPIAACHRATKGGPGQGALRHGRNGRDQVLLVPPGTTVIDAEQGFVIKDLKKPGDQFVVARGGKGGRGNAHSRAAPTERHANSPRENRAKSAM